MKKPEMFRQGDILFVRVNKKPDKVVKAKDNVVAHGEATGHSHRVMNGDLWTDEFGALVVESDGDAAIIHDEHPRLDLPKGLFQVVRQREYVEPKDGLKKGIGVNFRTVRD